VSLNECMVPKFSRCWSPVTRPTAAAEGSAENRPGTQRHVSGSDSTEKAEGIRPSLESLRFHRRWADPGIQREILDEPALGASDRGMASESNRPIERWPAPPSFRGSSEGHEQLRRQVLGVGSVTLLLGSKQIVDPLASAVMRLVEVVQVHSEARDPMAP